jgi:hypothetical protein
MSPAGELQARKYYDHVARVLQVRDELSGINPLWKYDLLNQLRLARPAGNSSAAMDLHKEVVGIQQNRFRWALLKVLHFASCRTVNARLVLLENFRERSIANRTVNLSQNLRVDLKLKGAVEPPFGIWTIGRRLVGKLHEGCGHD